jgi:hypothetical protein
MVIQAHAYLVPELRDKVPRTPPLPTHPPINSLALVSMEKLLIVIARFISEWHQAFLHPRITVLKQQDDKVVMQLVTYVWYGS